MLGGSGGEGWDSCRRGEAFESQGLGASRRARGAQAVAFDEQQQQQSASKLLRSGNSKGGRAQGAEHAELAPDQGG